MKKYLLTFSGLILSIAPVAMIASCAKTIDDNKFPDNNENKEESVQPNSIRVWAQDESNEIIMDKVFQFTSNQATLQDLMDANNDYFKLGVDTQYGKPIEQIKNTVTGNWISAIYGIDNAWWGLSSPTYDKDTEINDSDFLSSKEKGDDTLTGASGITLKHKDVFVLSKMETDALKLKKEIMALSTDGKIATNITDNENKLPSEVIRSEILPFAFTPSIDGSTITWDIKEDGIDDPNGELTIVVSIDVNWSQIEFDITLTGFQKFEDAYAQNSFVRIWARIRDNDNSPYLGTKLFDITFRVTEDITNVASWMNEQTDIFKFNGTYLREIYNIHNDEWIKEWSDAYWTEGEFWSLWSPTDQDSIAFPKKEYNANEFLTTNERGTFSNDFIGSFDVDHTVAKGHIIGWIFAPVSWMWGTFPEE